MNNYVKYSEWIQIILLFCMLVQSVVFWIGSAIANGLGNVKYPIDISAYYMRASIFIIIVVILQVLKMVFITSQSINWLTWAVPILSIVSAIVISILNVMLLKIRLNNSLTLDIYDVLMVALVLGAFINSILQLFIKKGI